MKKRIKVTWICHFSNKFVQNKLPLNNKYHYEEFASWIPNTIKQLENNKETELHIISPHRGLKRLIYSYKHNQVYYHFFQSDIPLIHKKLWHIPMSYINRFIDEKYKYLTNKFLIKQFVKKISPDIIHLQGAENAYYSSSIFQFKDEFPVLVTIQGYISKTKVQHNARIRYKIKVEKQILQEFKHFGIRTKTMGEDVRNFNTNAVLHWHGYGMNEITPINTEKKYDVVFFARICKDKGIKDLLEALALVKKKISSVSLIVIGPNSEKYLNFLKEKAKHLKINNNIKWSGFQPTQKDVFKLASQAKISVLPTYHDIIPGTIIESMKLSIPVIAYKTGSIPEVNEGDKRVEIVERFDITELAKTIIRLLEDESYRNELAVKALKYANKKFSDDNLVSDLICAYKNVIEDFNRKKRI